MMLAHTSSCSVLYVGRPGLNEEQCLELDCCFNPLDVRNLMVLQ